MVSCAPEEDAQTWAKTMRELLLSINEAVTAAKADKECPEPVASAGGHPNAGDSSAASHVIYWNVFVSFSHCLAAFCRYNCISQLVPAFCSVNLDIQKGFHRQQSGLFWLNPCLGIDNVRARFF